MKGTLYIQFDKRGKRIKKPEALECEVDLGRDGTALAGMGKRVVADLLTRARVEFISANGLVISGVVKSGNDPFPVLRHQEWWFVPGAQG